MAASAVNLYTAQYDVYIGRAGKNQDGYFGNPHPVGTWCKTCNKAHTQSESVTAYKKDFDERIEIDSEFRERVLALRGKKLGCFCKPKACHGDVIAAFLNSLGE